MIKSRLVTNVALALAVTATPSALLSQTALSGSNQPITFRYITTGQFNNGGYLSFGTTFWATNHTSKELMVSLSAIEVRTGSNWTARPLPGEPLQFRPHGKPLTQLLLQPHDAGYATPQFSGWPTNGTWRVRVAVDEKLTGSAATVTHLRQYPDLMERRFRTGDTNIPVNPFSPKYHPFRRVTQVVSPEISDE